MVYFLSKNVLELLSKPVRNIIYERGFKNLTPPQIKAIPYILSGENVLIVAPTGTGKTEAAIIPIIDMMLRGRRGNGINLLYITPLRALNRDMIERLNWWFRRFDFKIAVRHGDTPPDERRLQAIYPPDVLVTTPETLQLIFSGKRLREHLNTVKWVIVDEVHELVPSKRGAQLSILLERLRRKVGDFQIIGLSATIGNPEEVSRYLVGVRGRCKIIYVPVAKMFRIKIFYPKPTNIDKVISEKYFLYPDISARVRLIKDFIGKYNSLLIFTNTRPMAELLGSRLKLLDMDLPIFTHHGSLSASTRTWIESGLKRGEIKGVVCTSSLELGIDIGHIDFIIQYNSPRQVSKLIQRIGRSAHYIGGVSEGAIIVSNTNDALEALVLVKMVGEEKIEPSEILDKPYDVVVHEICGLLIERFEINISTIYNILRDSMYFKSLSLRELNEIIEYMNKINLIRYGFNEDVIRRGSRIFDYFYGNLSMIPESIQYVAIDLSENLPIGLLDDFFVSEYLEPGVRFIMAGRTWEVDHIIEDKVYVNPIEDYIGAIPSWIGEEIPVPFEVAQEVGLIRGIVEKMALSKVDLNKISEYLSHLLKYNDLNLISNAISDVYEMAIKNIPVPTDKRIVVEKAGEIIYIHSHFGTRVNRTIGKYLVSQITSYLGTPVFVKEKPYGILFKTKDIDVKDIVWLLKNVSRREFKTRLTQSIINSRLFKWRLSQLAKKMGVIDPDTKLTNISLDQLVTSLENTPVFKEALREVLERDLDIDRTLKIIDSINSGEISIVDVRGPTPLLESSIKYVLESLEPVPLERRIFLRILTYRAKLMSNIVTEVCLNCRKYIEEKPIFRLEVPSICPICGSSQVTITTDSVEEVYRYIDNIDRRKGKYRILKRNLKLYERYGRLAAMALSTRLPYNQIKEALTTSRNEEELIKKLWRLEKLNLLRKRRPI